MSLWKRTMDYLGLGPDDAYDDYDVHDDSSRSVGRAVTGGRSPNRSSGTTGRQTTDDHVRPVPGRPTLPVARLRAAPSRSPRCRRFGVNPRPSSRTGIGGEGGASTGEPTTVRPRRFDQAQEVADRFKEGQPVIMNLESTEREVARRLIDFASGLCYGLDGSMEKVATGVYLLKPAPRRHIESATTTTKADRGPMGSLSQLAPAGSAVGPFPVAVLARGYDPDEVAGVPQRR